MNQNANSETFVKEQYQTSNNLEIRPYLHSKYSTNKYGWMKWLFDNMNFNSGCKVLELGCGNGELWSNNLYRVGSDWDIVLTDFSEGMLETAKDKINDIRFKFFKVDAQKIPFEDNSFDIVIANHMLYHIPDREIAIKEIRRVLKSGGTFYASTLGVKNMIEMSELVNNFDARIKYPMTSEIISFNLENGTDELSKFFREVRRERYEDSFVITEAEPVINYVLSLKEIGNIAKVLVDDRIVEFKRYIEEIIKEKGEIYITKDAGLFKAQK